MLVVRRVVFPAPNAVGLVIAAAPAAFLGKCAAANGAAANTVTVNGGAGAAGAAAADDVAAVYLYVSSHDAPPSWQA